MSQIPPDFSGAACPIPISDYPYVLMAHGGGGRLSQMLIEKMFVPAFDNTTLEQLNDGAVLGVEAGRLAFSTDSFVVNPLFFPGGDIGSLAVHGTVNDLAMCGAAPLALSVGMIIEEGLPMQTLWQIVQSMQAAARSRRPSQPFAQDAITSATPSAVWSIPRFAIFDITGINISNTGFFIFS